MGIFNTLNLPAQRQIDDQNKFGRRVRFAFSWPKGDSELWEAKNRRWIAKTGEDLNTVAQINSETLSGKGVFAAQAADSPDSGRNSRYQVPSDLQHTYAATDSFVIAFVGSMPGNGGFYNLIGNSSGDAHALRFNDTGATKPSIKMRGSGGTSTITSTKFPWSDGTNASNKIFTFHVVIDRTGGTGVFQVYIDGKFAITGTPGSALGTFDIFDIFSGFNTSGFGWHGLALELQVLNGFMSHAEIHQHYQNITQIYIQAPSLPIVSAPAVGDVTGTLDVTLGDTTLEGIGTVESIGENDINFSASFTFADINFSDPFTFADINRSSPFTFGDINFTGDL